MIAGVILAAGSATRMGSVKQLADVEGRPILQHAIDRAAAGGLGELVVVLGHAAEEIEREVRLPAEGRFVRNPDYASGQGSSLAAGLRALGPDVRAAVILLGDQPDVDPAAVLAVRQSYEDAGGPVVRARYAGEPGHPVLIERRVWDRVGALGRDHGAGPALSEHPEWVRWVDLDGPAPQEVDTAADLERVRERGLG